MNANQIIRTLEWVEVTSGYAPDCRRVMRAERFALLAATRSGDVGRIRRATAEAKRVAAMWGVRLSAD